uniref:Uncharacterized protein n=1 Tax=Picea glauca TaxID=3330 RepID=A0A101LVY0_PICGL|nr:hypothetical protein ABT39_MTgene1853 [Picea glauca]
MLIKECMSYVHSVCALLDRFLLSAVLVFPFLIRAPCVPYFLFAQGCARMCFFYSRPMCVLTYLECTPHPISCSRGHSKTYAETSVHMCWNRLIAYFCFCWSH